jgi:hypothetical protein
MFMFYAITVPTTIYNRIAPAAKVDALRSEVKAALADAFGGYTETVGTSLSRRRSTRSKPSPISRTKP